MNKYHLMRHFFFLNFCFVFVSICHAQDPHFSQFFTSPLTLNPAFTGKFDGQVRVAGNYRNQWPTINKAFITATGGVDFHILQNKISPTDIWGVGIMALTDQSAAGSVNYNYLSASTAFHKGLDEDGYEQLGGGVQVTYANMSINTAKLKFEDQLTPNGFTGTSLENFNGSTLQNSYVDINAGLLYTKSTNDKNNFYGGVSAYHITRPRQQFIAGNNSFQYLLDPRITFHAGGYFGIGDITTLHLSALYSTQANAHETVIGGALQFTASTPENSENPVSLYVGSWLRFQDAIIPYVGLEYGEYRFGVTYDVNTSALKTASQSRGGIEISLIYIKKSQNSKGLPCPKF